MKLSYFFNVMLFLSCALFYAPTNCMFQRAPKTEEIVQREQDQEIKRLAEKLNQAIFDVLIGSMQTLEVNLEYWRKAQNSPTYHTLHNPSSWLDTKETTTAIHECILELEDLEKKHAEALGSLYLHQQKQKTFKAEDYAFNSLMVQLPCFKYSDGIMEGKNLTFDELCAQLKSRTAIVKLYKKTFDEKIKACKRPSHLSRHWWKYTLGAIATLAAGNYLHQHQHEIPGWYQNACDTIKTRWQEHVTEPLKEIWKHLAQKNDKDKAKDSIEQPDTKKLTPEENFRKNLKNYFEKKDPALVPSDINSTIDEIVDGDPVDLINDMDQDSQTIRSDIFRSRFQLPHTLALLIQFLHFQGKKELEIQKINMMLGAMFPAFLLLYGAQKASAALFSKLFLKKGIYIPLQNRVAAMYAMLNNLESASTMNLEMHGKLLYHISIVEKFTRLMPLEFQTIFKANIETLKAADKSVQQKKDATLQIQMLTNRLNA